jgi:hypothetical protein
VSKKLCPFPLLKLVPRGASKSHTNQPAALQRADGRATSHCPHRIFSNFFFSSPWTSSSTSKGASKRLKDWPCSTSKGGKAGPQQSTLFYSMKTCMTFCCSFSWLIVCLLLAFLVAMEAPWVLMEPQTAHLFGAGVAKSSSSSSSSSPMSSLLSSHVFC